MAARGTSNIEGRWEECSEYGDGYGDIAWLCRLSCLTLREPPFRYDFQEGSRGSEGLIGRWTRVVVGEVVSVGILVGHGQRHRGTKNPTSVGYQKRRVAGLICGYHYLYESIAGDVATGAQRSTSSTRNQIVNALPDGESQVPYVTAVD